MEFTAGQIAEALGGVVEGNQYVKVSNLSKIEEGKPGTISFLANPKYTKFIYNTQADIVIVNKDFKPEKPVSATLVRVEDAYVCFSQLLEMYAQTRLNKEGVSKFASIAKSAKIGNNVYIGDFAVIGDDAVIADNAHIYPHVYVGDGVKVGQDSVLFSGVKVYHDCVIGNACTLHSGVVIGADGFGFAPQAEGQDYKKVAQIGNVILHDNVEIGANTTVDRATLGSTVIHQGVKLDNLVQIAHNVEVGARTVIAAQTGVSGSSTIGQDCMIGGQVGIAGHVKIGNKVMIAAQSGIGGDVKDGAVIQGSPAFDIAPYRRSYVHFRRLPDIVKRIEKLEKGQE